MLIRGESVGSWVIEDAVGLAVPRTYRARHPAGGTEALVKVVPLSKATAEGQVREEAALRRLRHASLPEVLDFGIEHERGFVWTAFAWFEFESLQDRLQAGQVDWRDACRLLRDVAQGLAHVHAEGFVHRDLRPANVLVGLDWEAKLTGFEFAMTQEQLERLSEAPFGDLAYLAPEVLKDPVHHGSKADVYAFGCLAYEALTGHPAFPAAAWGEKADQATRMLEWKARASALDPGDSCPDWLRSMIMKCGDPDPDRRLPDLEALVGWLDAARPSWQLQKTRATPAPASREASPAPPILAPTVSIAQPRPMRAPPSILSSRPPPQSGAMPVVAQYFAAAMLGCLCALGFSSVIILFVELRDGVL